MSFRLVVIHPDGSTRNIDVGSEPITIGRAEGTDIQLDEARVSRHHCVVFAAAGRLNVQDQGSANGTVVNGAQVSHSQLRHGDEIAIGSARVRVEVLGVQGAARITAPRVASPLPRSPRPSPSATRRRDSKVSWPPADPGVVTKLGELYSSSDEPEDAAEAALDLLFEAVPLDRAYVLVGPPYLSTLSTVATRYREGFEDSGGPSMLVAEEVLASNEPVLCTDLNEDPSLVARSDLDPATVGGVLCGTLEFDGFNIGVLYGDVAPGEPFLSKEVPGVFQMVCQQAGAAIGRAQEIAALRRRQRILASERDELDRLARTLEREIQARAAEAEDQGLELALRASEVAQVSEARKDLTVGLIRDVSALVADVEASLDRALAGEDSDRAALEAGRAELHRIVAMTEDSLSAVQLEHGSLGLKTRPTPADPILKECVTRYETYARAKGVRLTRGPSPRNLRVVADATILSRVLHHLIGVAIAEAGKGGEVSVTVHEAETKLDIVISEKGRGLSAEDRERQLDLWSRLGALTARELGAGFYFCRLAVEAQGGRARLEGDAEERRWVITLQAQALSSFEDKTRA